MDTTKLRIKQQWFFSRQKDGSVLVEWWEEWWGDDDFKTHSPYLTVSFTATEWETIGAFLRQQVYYTERSRFYTWYDDRSKCFELRSRTPDGTRIWMNGKDYGFLNSGDYYRRPKTAAEAWRHLPEWAG